MATLPRLHRRHATAWIVLGWLGAATAQTALDTLATLGRFLDAAASLFSGAQARVERLGLDALPAAEREAARAELIELVVALDVLLPVQGVFIGDLHSYHELAREQRFDSPAQRERVWRAAMAAVDDISEAARDVMAVVARPGSRLGVALADADRLTLQSALAERQALLSRLKAMPPPATAGELAQLAQLAERYARLRRAAFDLRVALQAALPGDPRASDRPG
jgi:hypothetical protein